MNNMIETIYISQIQEKLYTKRVLDTYILTQMYQNFNVIFWYYGFF